MRLIGQEDFKGFGALKAQMEHEAQGLEHEDWYKPLLDPRGVIHCVRVPIAGHRRPKGALGLVPAHKSTNRYGTNGASPHARKAINVSARCLNRYSHRVAFGAFTPSPVDMDAIECAPGGSANFQRRLGNALSSALLKKGLTPVWMLIPEISPRRSQAWGRPAIHWHFLALCKGSRYEKEWWLSKSEWLGVYRKAFQWHTGIEPADDRASTRCSMARNPARYLSKYLSKTTGEIKGVDYSAHVDALPRQWQSRSDAMRKMHAFYTGRLPASFAQFLSEEYRLLEGLGLGFARHWHPPSCDRFEVCSFYVKDLGSLALIWERFIAWCPSPAVAPGVDRTDEVVPRPLTLRPMEVHQQGEVAPVIDRVSALEAVTRPVAEQIDFLDRCLRVSEVVTPVRPSVLFEDAGF